MSDRQIADSVDSAGKSVASAIDAQTKVLQAILDFIHPAQLEAKMGSAEEDKIDDSAGVYQLDAQTRKQLKDKWIELGYPPDLAKHI